jgi:hypothetical protein
MMPQANHPLTRVFISSARARTYTEMRDALALIEALSKGESETTIAACKLAAEIFLEMNREPIDYRRF